MRRKPQSEEVVAEIKLDGSCPQEQILQPLRPRGETVLSHLAGWETPLAPWGGYNTSSGIEVVRVWRDGRTVLHFSGADRALIWGDGGDMRDYRVEAEVLPHTTDIVGVNKDQADRTQAMIGIVFRWHTSREYYQFGIESRRRAVLYRRKDEEWHVLAEKEVELAPQGQKEPDGEPYVKLVVESDGDTIRCRCDSLGVDFCCYDTAYPVGKPGIRCAGVGRVLSLRITQTRSQAARTDVYRHVREVQEKRLSETIPDPVLVREFDVSQFPQMPRFYDFVQPGRFDMLFTGETLKAMTADGKVLWEIAESVRDITFSGPFTKHGRLLYALCGDRKAPEQSASVSGQPRVKGYPKYICVIRGADGKIVARTEIPALDVQSDPLLAQAGSANLSGRDGLDFVLIESRYDSDQGGLNLWAYDHDLNLLWHNRVKQPYGHQDAVQYLDVNGDGRDEVLAGGAMFDCEGRLMWIHDRVADMDRIPGSGHYDAAALGNFSGDADVDPVAFLCSGSAGVYVVDALTGRTRMTHRMGHAQGFSVVKMRKDLPGQQILVPNRWSNFGILTLFTGYGDRLWSIQPGFVGQGANPVAWPDPEEQLIYHCQDPKAIGLYDGYGRKVKDLPEFRKVWGDRMWRDVLNFRGKMGDDPRDLIGIGRKEEGKLYLYAPGV